MKGFWKRVVARPIMKRAPSDPSYPSPRSAAVTIVQKRSQRRFGGRRRAPILIGGAMSGQGAIGGCSCSSIMALDKSIHDLIASCAPRRR
jgi:hypothetical protein